MSQPLYIKNEYHTNWSRPSFGTERFDLVAPIMLESDDLMLNAQTYLSFESVKNQMVGVLDVHGKRHVFFALDNTLSPKSTEIYRQGQFKGVTFLPFKENKSYISLETSSESFGMKVKLYGTPYDSEWTFNQLNNSFGQICDDLCLNKKLKYQDGFCQSKYEILEKKYDIDYLINSNINIDKVLHVKGSLTDSDYEFTEWELYSPDFETFELNKVAQISVSFPDKFVILTTDKNYVITINNDLSVCYHLPGTTGFYQGKL